ncbi:hypothetical protein GGQ90_005309 [Sphingobium scionense]|uniref:Uncharacterized protein n=1 Tax=Sphingobium scionense TaxID=1404341 RepID=A0A7W6PXF5_9SPHN|nr:hypothetical protein [Sphingobium scionense]
MRQVWRLFRIKPGQLIHRMNQFHVAIRVASSHHKPNRSVDSFPNDMRTGGSVTLSEMESVMCVS